MKGGACYYNLSLNFIVYLFQTSEWKWRWKVRDHHPCQTMLCQSTERARVGRRRRETGKGASDYSEGRGRVRTVGVSAAANRRHIANSSREPPVNIRYWHLRLNLFITVDSFRVRITTKDLRFLASCGRWKSAVFFTVYLFSIMGCPAVHHS